MYLLYIFNNNNICRKTMNRKTTHSLSKPNLRIRTHAQSDFNRSKT